MDKINYLIICILGIVIIQLVVQINNYKLMYSRYVATNNYCFVAKARNFDKIQYETGVKCIYAINMQENSGDLFECGVKRIPLFIMMRYPIQEWQARTAAWIVTQEMYEYCKKKSDFWSHLGKRYSADPEWSKGVEKWLQ